MAKLYQREGLMLSANMPKEEIRMDNMLGNALSSLAKQTSELSQKNYALGKAQLIEDVLLTSFNSSKDNPQQFKDMVLSGLEKATEGLPDKQKKDILVTANSKFMTLQEKATENLNTRLDNENKNRIVNLFDSNINNAGGLNDINSLLISSIVSELGENEIDTIASRRKEMIRRLSKLSEARDRKGSYVIGNEAKRSAIQSGEYNMKETVLDTISTMDSKALKSFYERSFSNREAFTEKTGLSNTSWADIDGKIRKRFKDLGNTQKLQMKAQNAYDASIMFSKDDENILEQQYKNGFIKEQNYKDLKEIFEFDRVEVNKGLKSSQQKAFVAKFSALKELVSSQDDGTEVYSDSLIKTAVEARRYIQKISEATGTTEELDGIMKRVIASSLVDQEYADTVNSVFEEGSAAYELIRANGLQNFSVETTKDIDKKIEEENKVTGVDIFNRFNGRGRNSDINRATNRKVVRRDLFTEFITGRNSEDILFEEAKNNGDFIFEDEKGRYIVRKDEVFNDREKEKALKVAMEGISTIIQISEQARQLPQGDEQRDYLFEQARKVKVEMNKELIKIKFGKLIDRDEFNRLEEDLKNGKKALFNRFGEVYEYKGMTNNDLIISKVLR